MMDNQNNFFASKWPIILLLCGLALVAFLFFSNTLAGAAGEATAKIIGLVIAGIGGFFSIFRKKR